MHNEPKASSPKSNKSWVPIRVTNIRIFKYFPIQIFVCIIFYTNIFGYSFIRFFDANIFRYSFVWFFYMNKFGYSFVSFFDTNILKRKILTCAPKSPKVKWLKLFRHRLIYIEKLCWVNYVFFYVCCITHKTLPEAQRTQKLTPWLGLNLSTTWHQLQ